MSLAVLSTPTVTAECLGLTMTQPRRGMVPAHVELSADVAPIVGEPVTLTFASETGAPQIFKGTVRRRGLWAGRCRVVVAMGAGGLRDTLTSRDHVGGSLPVTALLIAQGIADAAGETLAPSCFSFLQSLTLPRWTRAGSDATGDGGTAVEALDALITRLALLAGQPELTWRILPSGELWIGVDTFPEGGDSGNVFIDDDDDGRIDCAPPAATLLPGTTINGRLAERVTYRINGDALRAEVLYTVPGDLSANETPDVYRESHAGTVITQHQDGTIDLAIDDPRLTGNGMRNVPFRVGIPGSTVTIPFGARVWIAFADADPSQPFAFAIDQDITATHALAIVGDSTSNGTLSGTCAAPGSPVQFLYVPDSGVPQTGPSISLSGTITGPGAKYVKAVKGP